MDWVCEGCVEDELVLESVEDRDEIERVAVSVTFLKIYK